MREAAVNVIVALSIYSGPVDPALFNLTDPHDIMYKMIYEAVDKVLFMCSFFFLTLDIGKHSRRASCT